MLQFAVSGETESFGSNNLMGQWLKTIGGYTVPQAGQSFRTLYASMTFLTRPRADNYPSGVTAFGIVSTLVCATWTDATRSRARWPVLVYMSTCVVIASICILVWRSPTGLKFFAYCACFRYTLERGVLSGVAQISPVRATRVRRRRSRMSQTLPYIQISR